MKKGLFTSLEEIRFQHDYVQGNAEPVYDPNAKNPSVTKHLSTKKQNKRILKTFYGRIR